MGLEATTRQDKFLSTNLQGLAGEIFASVALAWVCVSKGMWSC